jgi:hypothetical protein
MVVHIDKVAQVHLVVPLSASEDSQFYSVGSLGRRHWEMRPGTRDYLVNMIFCENTIRSWHTLYIRAAARHVVRKIRPDL